MSRGGENAAEDEAEGEHEVGEVAGCFGTVHAGDYEVREGAGEHEERPDEEEHEAAAFGDCMGGLRVAVESDRVVPAEED